MNAMLPRAAIAPTIANGSAKPRIILDVTRTIARTLATVPTGIDRVELAYCLHLLAAVPDRLEFAFVLPFTWRLIPARQVVPLIEATETRWRSGQTRIGGSWPGLLRLAATAWPRHPRWLRRRPSAESIYINVSHQWLDRPAVLRSMLRHERARMLCLVHDTIPIDMPEYVRPGEARVHQVRMQTVATMAAAIITNSRSTAASVQAFIGRQGGTGGRITCAPLGIDDAPRDSLLPPRLRDVPYFVTLGTIEPRKNHLLLLHLWRRFAATLGAAAPKLIVIGKRGWENENVIDLIERAAGMRGLVEEHNDLPDRAVSALLGGARALLFPSFAEGYGLPLAEALAAGTPVLASDLPALREVGGDVPEYLDPLDAPAWATAIRDYTDAASPRRSAQLARLAGWRPTRWDDHIATVLAVGDAMMSRARP